MAWVNPWYGFSGTFQNIYRISSIKRPGRLFVETIFKGALIRGRALIKKSTVIAEVIGGRKRENGLVVPCLYKCLSKNKKIAEILIKEVSNSSEKYQHMD